MLRSLKDLDRYTLAATDGPIGRVVNFLLDDKHWTVRYLVVETGSTFDGRKALISPNAFREVDWSTLQFHVSLSAEKIRSSPNVDTDRPVSRELERDFSQYYEYLPYWEYSELLGSGSNASQIVGALPLRSLENPPQSKPEGHLRSAKELRGYHVQGTDEALGHVADFIVDDKTWEIKYLVVDTSDWWFGKKVLIAPQWTSQISWENRTIDVCVSRDFVAKSPEWDVNAPVNREYEVRLYDYHGRPAYWATKEAHDAVPEPMPASAKLPFHPPSIPG